MTKENYTHLTIVVDRSGSMSSIREDAEGGINQLIKDQVAGVGDITISLFQFDTEYERVFGPVDAAEAPQYTLTPRGATALLDAMGRSMAETGEWITGLSEDQRPSKVIFCTVTDGMENSSQEFTSDKVKEAVELQTNTYNWEFLFLAANIDAVATGSSMGITNNTQYAPSAASTKRLYRGTSDAILRARTGEKGGSAAAFMPKNIDSEGNAT